MEFLRSSLSLMASNLACQMRSTNWCLPRQTRGLRQARTKGCRAGERIRGVIRLHSSAVLAVHSQCTILEPPRVKTQIWQRSRMPAAHLADDVLGALLQIPHRLGAAQGKRRGVLRALQVPHEGAHKLVRRLPALRDLVPLRRAGPGVSRGCT